MNTVHLEQLLHRYKSGHSLEQPFYTSNEVFDAEWDCIFRKHWLYAGNVAQLKKAGDYFLYHLRNDAVIVVRGNDDRVHAHYNTCTHQWFSYLRGAFRTRIKIHLSLSSMGI